MRVGGGVAGRRAERLGRGVSVRGDAALEAALTPRVGCVVLAAGAGRRFGGEKLRARLGSAPLLQAAIDAACGSSALACTLVVGAGAAQLLAAVDTRRCRVAINPKWQTGLASSLRCGLGAHAGDDACIIMLGDQPLVTSADLDRLIDVWSGRVYSTEEGHAAPAPIVALRTGDIWGAPVLFPRRDFAALLRLHGDAGAKRYAAQHLDRLTFVDALDARAFDDVDTPDDLTRLNGRGTRRIRR